MVGSQLAGVTVAALGLPGMFRLFSLAAAVAMVGTVIFVREPSAQETPEG
jgi:hypothetical protein